MRQQQLPRAICVSFTDHDLDHSRVPSDEQVVEVYHRIMAKKFTKIQRRLSMGEVGECYRTVGTAVEVFGGRPVFGWLFKPDNVVTGRNVLAPYHCCGHVIWRSPHGEFTELIDAYKGMKFLADEFVTNNSQVGLSFLDSISDGKHIEWIHSNVTHRCISLW